MLRKEGSIMRITLFIMAYVCTAFGLSPWCDSTINIESYVFEKNEFNYTVENKLISKTTWNKENNLTFVYSLIYDTFNRISIIKQNGIDKFIYRYDSISNMIYEEYTEGWSKTWEYSNKKLLSSSTLSNRYTSKVEYIYDGDSLRYTRHYYNDVYNMRENYKVLSDGRIEVKQMKPDGSQTVISILSGIFPEIIYKRWSFSYLDNILPKAPIVSKYYTGHNDSLNSLSLKFNFDKGILIGYNIYHTVTSIGSSIGFYEYSPPKYSNWVSIKCDISDTIWLLESFSYPIDTSVTNDKPKWYLREKSHKDTIPLVSIGSVRKTINDYGRYGLTICRLNIGTYIIYCKGYKQLDSLQIKVEEKSLQAYPIEPNNIIRRIGAKKYDLLGRTFKETIINRNIKRKILTY